MRFQVLNSKNDSGSFDIENFEIKDGGKSYKYLTLSMIEKWLTLIAFVVTAFLSAAGIYGMLNGGNFSAFEAIWAEVKEPLFVAATFVARGMYDQRE